MDYSGAAELRIVEDGAPRYNKFLVQTFASKFQVHGILKKEPILDFGAGIGTLSLIMRDSFGFQVHCLEVDESQRSVLKERKFHVFNSLQDLNLSYQAIYSSNVLEHIEDDEEALINLFKIASNQAVLIVYVPAFEFLFSPLDQKVGHWRRYSKKQLISVVEKAGWKIIEVEYVDSLGVVGWLFQKYLQILMKSSSPAKTFIQFYDFIVFPVSRMFDRIFMKRFAGKNLLLVAQKMNSEVAL
jgi:ubiquinone/menaquinone biosynthesis C-methylase UbiE